MKLFYYCFDLRLMQRQWHICTIYTLPNGVAVGVDACTATVHTAHARLEYVSAMIRFQMLSSIELQFY